MLLTSASAGDGSRVVVASIAAGSLAVAAGMVRTGETAAEAIWAFPA
jgi:hypothetical protein